MRAGEIQEFFQSLLPYWQYPDDTVDTIKSGNPDDEVTGIAIGWMSYNWALNRAVELGCNVFITHEPTYYNHYDNDPDVFEFSEVQEKRRFIEDNGLVIIRCHDLWDSIKRIGIPDSWGDYLGFENPIEGNEHIRIYQIQPQSALQVAQLVADRTRYFGQSAVQLIGPDDKSITRLSIGTGAITPYLKIVRKYKVDLAICTDDGIDYWKDGAFAIDMGIPIVVVNHPVSEEFGIYHLAELIKENFPQVAVHYIPQNCMYRLVSSSPSSNFRPNWKKGG